MVDALASGASIRKDVEVRVLSWAPKNLLIHAHICSKPLIFQWFIYIYVSIAEHTIPPISHLFGGIRGGNTPKLGKRYPQMQLSELKISKAKSRNKPYKLADGGGLFLLVKPNRSKLWQQKYRHLGKARLLSHGQYPDVTLAQARQCPSSEFLGPEAA